MVYTDQLQTKKQEQCRCAQMSGVDVCWAPSVQGLPCCSWDCLGSVSAHVVPKAACALKLELGSGIQQLDKCLVNLLTYSPKHLIEFNTLLTILYTQKNYFCRFLTDVKIALPLRHESHRCSCRDPCILTASWIKDLFYLWVVFCWCILGTLPCLLTTLGYFCFSLSCAVFYLEFLAFKSTCPACHWHLWWWLCGLFNLCVL